MGSTPGRGRRTTPVAGTLAGLATYGLVVLALVTPVPYMVQMPGPVVNTIPAGDNVVEVSGTESFAASGQLDLLTVSVAGGPGRDLRADQIIGSVIDPTDTVVPEEAFYPLDTTREQVTATNEAQMASSQDLAVAAALGELGIDHPLSVTVQHIESDSPAAGVLEVGDRLLTVDGTDLTAGDDGARLVASTVAESAGAPVELGIERRGSEQTVEVVPEASADGHRIGIVMDVGYDFPFEVRFDVADEIGGPSAGTIFALALIDALTEGDLTGGVPIAGTGSIDAAGTVSPIGGARQKVVAAATTTEDRAAAEHFLSPTDNCAEVVDAAAAFPDLTVVRVDDLPGARVAVESIATGETDALPACGDA
ncbi:YlbL family protein [Brevibacterium litoralis]|uniref:YlbL family protein n=1 Tax=Brevibacterium litoralis TaxID=3138935 RepID=UPI0032EC0DB8